MNRIFYTILFFFTVSIPAFSQIQNKFFGATLGVSDIETTYSAMYNYFGKKPKIILGFVTQGGQSQYFAGYNWDAINAYFHNGRFSQVFLRYHGNWNASSEIIISVYENLKKELNAKYGGRPTIMYKSIQEDCHKGFLYFDG